MTVKLTKASTLPIGVDVGTSSVKLAQLRLNPDGAELLCAGDADIPDFDASARNERMSCLAGKIAELLRTRPFKGRNSVLSLPAAETFVQHIKLPKLPKPEVAGAVERELAGKLPYGVEDAIIRHLVVGEDYGDGDAKQEVLVAAVARKTLDEYLAMSRRAKLDVTCVNIESLALVECFSRLFRRAGDSERTVMFIDIGQASTQVVLAHGVAAVFARNLPRGGAQFDRAVAEQLVLSPERAREMRRAVMAGSASGDDAEHVYQALEEPLTAMAGELTQCLRYYDSVFRNRSVERAIFVGGQADDKRLCQQLAQRLNLPAQIGDPLVRIASATTAQSEGGLDRRRPQPRWAVAVGLSLGANTAA